MRNLRSFRFHKRVTIDTFADTQRSSALLEGLCIIDIIDVRGDTLVFM